MSIVLFGGEKGGTGKTTLATNMAAMLALQGKDVLLLDTDRQGTASFWATQETRNFFEQEEFQHLALVDTVLRDRIAFRKSGRDGLSVVEWKQDKKAVNEMNQLYKEVYCGD